MPTGTSLIPDWVGRVRVSWPCTEFTNAKVNGPARAADEVYRLLVIQDHCGVGDVLACVGQTLGEQQVRVEIV
jgi:hypothetical protein